MLRALVFALCLATLAAAGAQTLYKSVDPDGRVVYSDKPPADGRVDKTMKFDALPASAVPEATFSYVEQLRRVRALSPQPAATPLPATGAVLYTAQWCGYCRKAKAYLAAKGIAYQEFDIDTDAGKVAFAQAGGGRGIPLLLVGGRRLRGFSVPGYDAVFGPGR